MADLRTIEDLLAQPMSAEARAAYHPKRDEAFAALPSLARLSEKHPALHVTARANLIYDALVANLIESYPAYRAQESLRHYQDALGYDETEAVQDRIDDDLNPLLVRRDGLIKDHFGKLRADIGARDAEQLMGSIINTALNHYEEQTGFRPRVRRVETQAPGQSK